MIWNLHANFDRIYQQIKTRLTAKVIPVEIPVGQGPDFHGVVNLFTKRAHQFKRGVKTGEYEETDIPAEAKDQFDRYYNELIESISATDDTLLERYLEGGDISRDEAIAGMKEAMPTWRDALKRSNCTLRHISGHLDRPIVTARARQTCMTRARRCGFVAAQAGCAFFAVSTAWRISAREARATLATTSPVIG